MSIRDDICRPRFGPMSKLMGIWRFVAMSMSRRFVSKKVCDSGPCPWPQIIELSGTLLLLFDIFSQKEAFFSFVIQFI